MKLSPAPTSETPKTPVFLGCNTQCFFVKLVDESKMFLSTVVRVDDLDPVIGANRLLGVAVLFVAAAEDLSRS